jgi:hypothetical protein
MHLLGYATDKIAFTGPGTGIIYRVMFELLYIKISVELPIDPF